MLRFVALRARPLRFNLFLLALASLLLPAAARAQVAVAPSQTTLATDFNNNPSRIAVDRYGNVYIAYTANNAVQEILAVNGSIPFNAPTIVALGTGFNAPGGVAVDASGDVFVADTGNSAVKEIVAVNGSIPASAPTINTLGSGFSTPQGVAVDSKDDVFVADSGTPGSENSSVKEIVAVSGSIPASPTINNLDRKSVV